MNVDGKKENNFFNLLSFIVLFISAVLSLLGGILNGSTLVNVLKTISEVFILIVLAVSAYRFVSKKSKGWKIVYWISFAIYVASIVFIWIF